MSYTPPVVIVDGSWLGRSGYTSPVSIVYADWIPKNRITPVGVESPKATIHTVTIQQFARSIGWVSGSVGKESLATLDWQYVPSFASINATWGTSGSYDSAVETLNAAWQKSTGADDSFIFLDGWNSTAIGNASAVWSQHIGADGFLSSKHGTHVVRPPPLNASWFGAALYEAYSTELWGRWSPASDINGRYVYPNARDSSGYGTPFLIYSHIVKPIGMVATLFSSATIKNTSFQIIPSGFNSSSLPIHAVFNLRQYLSPEGFKSEQWGDAYLQGGVKNLSLNGIGWAGIGRPIVVNTTAIQTAKPKGIEWAGMGELVVSPRTLTARGFSSQLIGTAFVQRSPAPLGWQSSGFGYPAIEFKTKNIKTLGIDSFETYFPKVFDPTQTLLPPSFLQTGVFGDTAIKNTKAFITAQGVNSFESSSWADVRNSTRLLALSGWNSGVYGELAIANKSPNITPIGFDASLAASNTETGIGYANRHVEPRGFDSAKTGVPFVEKTPSLHPSGFAGASGEPTIWHAVRTVEAKGAPMQLLGSPSIWFRYRSCRLDGFDVSALGLPRLDHEDRSVTTIGQGHSAIGLPVIQLRTRSVSPASIWKVLASNHMIGGLRYIAPEGYSATKWGTRIIPESQTLYPLGFAGAFGWPVAHNLKIIVSPLSIKTTAEERDQWGTARFWNTRQYIELEYDAASGLEPPTWPQWTLIENRDKYLNITGTAMAKVGRHQIDNKATPILTQGIEAPHKPVSYKAGMVAFRIRPIQLEGLEAPYITGWSQIYNDASVLSPAGFNTGAYGVAGIETNRRFFSFQGWQDSIVGFPMIADAIRELDIESRYSIRPPNIPLPVVYLYTRYVDLDCFDVSRLGSPNLYSHRNVITTRWNHRDTVGEHRLHNVTPEIATRGRASDEHGTAFVRLEWRDVKPYETFTQIIPKPVIAFRDRSIAGQGFIALKVSDKLVVTGSASPPYTLQYIILDSVGDGESLTPHFGIEPPLHQVSNPEVNQQVLYPESKLPMTKYGTPTITANTIRVEPGIHEFNIGEHEVGLLHRVVSAKSVEREDFDLIGEPIVSPHTIWCTQDVTQQAINNHDSRLFQPIRGEVFGRVGVQNKHRVIKHTYPQNQYGNDMARVGAHGLQNKLHFILPPSFNSFRSGWHSIPSDKEIIEHNESYNGMAFGRAEISIVDYNTTKEIKHKGYVATIFGISSAELFNRSVLAKGYESLGVGTKVIGDKPYMWQGLRIGELMPTIPEGFDSDLHGTPWVSFRVREANIEGFDAFRCEYDVDKFIDRMKVTRREEPNVPASITPEGFDSFISSVPDIKPMTHFIRPDGNSEQYRKGAF